MRKLYAKCLPHCLLSGSHYYRDNDDDDDGKQWTKQPRLQLSSALICLALDKSTTPTKLLRIWISEFSGEQTHIFIRFSKELKTLIFKSYIFKVLLIYLKYPEPNCLILHLDKLYSLPLFCCPLFWRSANLFCVSLKEEGVTSFYLFIF